MCDKSTLKITLINKLVKFVLLGGGTEDFFPLPKVYYGDNTFRYSARSSSSSTTGMKIGVLTLTQSDQDREREVLNQTK